jgi:hypothetical protein
VALFLLLSKVMKSIKILDLKCSQMALGMLEVQEKAKNYLKLKKSKLIKELKNKPVCVVKSPKGTFYIIDGHHRTCALWLIEKKKVPIKIKKDFSKARMTYKQFWHYMKMHRYTHLYDQFGDGPHAPLYLPQDVRGLGDDPYRSLSWLVQVAGGYEKTNFPFAEFLWANFFRKYKLLHNHFFLNFAGAQKKALALAHSSAAKNLPGYIDPKKKRRQK